MTGFNPEALTPDWMATRLTQADMRPTSLGVGITNYVMSNWAHAGTGRFSNATGLIWPIEECRRRRL